MFQWFVTLELILPMDLRGSITSRYGLVNMVLIGTNSGGEPGGWHEANDPTPTTVDCGYAPWSFMYIAFACEYYYTTPVDACFHSINAQTSEGTVTLTVQALDPQYNDPGVGFGFDSASSCLLYSILRCCPYRPKDFHYDEEVHMTMVRCTPRPNQIF